MVGNRFAACGAHLSRMASEGRRFLLDTLTNASPSSDGRRPRSIRDRRRQPLDYSCFERYNFFAEVSSGSEDGAAQRERREGQ